MKHSPTHTRLAVASCPTDLHPRLQISRAVSSPPDPMRLTGDGILSATATCMQTAPAARGRISSVDDSSAGDGGPYRGHVSRWCVAAGRRQRAVWPLYLIHLCSRLSTSPSHRQLSFLSCICFSSALAVPPTACVIPQGLSASLLCFFLFAHAPERTSIHPAIHARRARSLLSFRGAPARSATSGDAYHLLTRSRPLAVSGEIWPEPTNGVMGRPTTVVRTVLCSTRRRRRDGDVCGGGVVADRHGDVATPPCGWRMFFDPFTQHITLATACCHSPETETTRGWKDTMGSRRCLRERAFAFGRGT